jgi:hypothetical protein
MKKTGWKVLCAGIALFSSGIVLCEYDPEYHRMVFPHSEIEVFCICGGSYVDDGWIGVGLMLIFISIPAFLAGSKMWLDEQQSKSFHPIANSILGLNNISKCHHENLNVNLQSETKQTTNLPPAVVPLYDERGRTPIERVIEDEA